MGAQAIVADDSNGPAFQPARSSADLGQMLADLKVVRGPQSGSGKKLELHADQFLHFRFELQPVEQEMAAAGGKTKPEFGILTIGVPEGFDVPGSQPLKVLFTSVTGDIYAPNAYSAMNYYRATRETDWLLVTVDGDVWPKRDSIQWRMSLMAAAMRYLSEVLRGFEEAQFAFGGYSGGSKMSVYLALFSARLGKVPVGLFLGGCNDAPIEDAEKLCGVSTVHLHSIPVVMSVGEKDRIAKPKQSRRVARQLERAGFQTVVLLTHPGGHRLVGEHISQALVLME